MPAFSILVLNLLLSSTVISDLKDRLRLIDTIFADYRTNIFMRSNKHYAHMRFFIPLFYVFFLGVFGIDQCKKQGLLNRDQTDEWKGWMQLVILTYHITGASAVSSFLLKLV